MDEADVETAGALLACTAVIIGSNAAKADDQYKVSAHLPHICGVTLRCPLGSE